MFHCLMEHPCLFMPTLKEPEYFSDDTVYVRGLDWYENLFAEKGDDQICGEASTTYSRWPHTPDVPSRIKRDLGEAKLLYILRHPIDRAYSHYCHHMRYEVSMTFEEALVASNIYVDCSLYARQIERYLRHFSMDSLHIELFEDYRTDPRAFLRRVQKFLGVEELDLERGRGTHANERHQEYVRRRTTGWIRSIPGGNRLADWIPSRVKETWHRAVRYSPIGRHLVKQHNIPKLLPETRSMLIEKFKAPNSELAEMIGRDLTHWSEVRTD